jgi:hypothetical protein
MTTLPGMAVMCSYCGQEGHDAGVCPNNLDRPCPYCFASTSDDHKPDCPNYKCPHCELSGGAHRPDCQNDPNYKCPYCPMMDTEFGREHIPHCPNNPGYRCPHCGQSGGNHRPDCPNHPDHSEDHMFGC